MLLQVESDETFDPSTLIDIEKFKAANVPAKQVSVNKYCFYHDQFYCFSFAIKARSKVHFKML